MHKRFPYIQTSGPISSFGGPSDLGVASDEGLALVTFLEAQTPYWRALFIRDLDPAKGLARQLNINAMYCAMRWDYGDLSKHELKYVIVRVSFEDRPPVWLRPVDYGPGLSTRRIIDVSPMALYCLGAKTDSVVNVEVYI